MKNRKIVEFVIYPRLFHSISLLYKGTYCISFKLYHRSASNKTTYAFPFLLNTPEHESTRQSSTTQQATVHTESNCSFQTERFYIIYEEDTRRLKSQCIFRLEYEEEKDYSTFLQCKLMKKQKAKKKEENNLCTRVCQQSKYETVDTQTLKINKIQRLNSHQRIYFHCSEFFSSVQLRICSFSYGTKMFRGKKQLSDMFEGCNLDKTDPTAILRHKKEKKEAEGQKTITSFRQLKDLSQEIIYSYNDLKCMLGQYEYWRSVIVDFREKVAAEQDGEGRKLTPFVDFSQSKPMESLSYLNRGHFLKELEIRKAYGIDRQEEAIAAILQEKELVRCNIRYLRQYYSTLLFYEPEKRFKSMVQKAQDIDEQMRQEKFVSFEPTTSEIIGGQLRYRASQDFTNQTVFCPSNIERIPCLLVQNYEKPTSQTLIKRLLPQQTLTVFVHGYQGNSFDFQKSKNYLKKHNPSTNILIVESITQQMNKSIEELGKKVAEEVVKHTEQTINRYDRINFVGFSLGGLLVRASLEHLGQLKSKLGIFVTFSSPHLGISECQNSLVNLGVWYLIKIDKVKNLKQLNFQSVKMHDSLLMKLSKSPHISNFTRVILVSSKDDGFVPLYSTFLEKQLCQKEILGLCNNLRNQIRRLERVEVLFNTDHAGTLDKLTGRRGHIQFLDNHFFLQQFFRLYGPYF